MSQSVRRADFAGSWYPGSERDCRLAFEEFEAGCVERKSVPTPRGGLVPHAGWLFSGRLAYNTIRELSRGAGAVDTVLLFGGHLRPGSPASVLGAGEFWTPLGTIPVDQELAAALARQTGIGQQGPEHHTPDNTVELQAPMVKHLLPEARLLVMAAPPREETLQLCDHLMRLAGELGRRVVAIGSTDLTHYGPNYGFSPRGLGPQAEAWVREENDRRFVELALALRPAEMIAEALQRSSACCPGAAAAAVHCGKRLGSSDGELLSYATSADVHRNDSFVGYASIIF
jgi:AmmeMemoRadiSam system protein B